MISNSRRILCVDGDANVRETLRQLGRDFSVSFADDAADGIERLVTTGPFAVVVVNWVCGAEFLREMRQLSPATVAIVAASPNDLAQVASAQLEGHVFRVLCKPIFPEILRKALHDCLKQYRLVDRERALAEQLADVNASLDELNATLEDRIRQRTAELASMHAFLAALHRADSLDAVTTTIVEQTASLLRVPRAALFLPDKDEFHLRLAACHPQDGRISLRDARVPIEGTATGRAFIETEPHFWQSSDDGPPLHRIETLVFGSASRLYHGLAAASKPVGVVVVATPRDSDELRASLRTIAEVAAIAVGNQLRRQQRDEMRDALIFALARLAESRDPETGSHLERVQIYCRLLAERMRAMPQFLAAIDDDFVDNLIRSAPLHDIGKVGIPDRILRKPGRLTPEEFELMKQHATIGGDTLRAVMAQGRTHGFLRMGVEIAYCHHERYDGTGYPKGLRSEEIPLAARILALADVYDALTTPRVYKSAITHEEAVETIKKERGKHFDPSVVDAFLDGLEDFDRTRHALADVVERRPREEALTSTT